MQEKLIRIEEKIDRMAEKISSIDTTLASQHESLKDHIRRTELLEHVVTPVVNHVTMFTGAIRFMLFIGSMCAMVESVIIFAEWLRK